MNKLLIFFAILCLAHSAAADQTRHPKSAGARSFASPEQLEFGPSSMFAAGEVWLPRSGMLSELTLNLNTYSLIQPEFTYLKDVRLLSAWNYRSDTSSVNYLPGLRLSWTVAGFDFLNTDIARYLNATRGLTDSSLDQESGAYKFNVNWRYPFALSNHGFSLEGQIEYVSSISNAFSEPLHPWILAQPRIRYDLARLLDIRNPTYLGLEYQYWRNQGYPGNDSSMQLKFSWGL